MQYMPAGSYDLVAWSDDDRDREVDFFELQDSTDIAVGSADTAVATVALLPQDTTPAQLARAEPLDSLTIRLLFDDYFAAGPVTGTARVYLLPDSVPGPNGDLVHSTILDSIRSGRADSAGAVTADTVAGAPADTVAPDEPEERAQPGERAARGREPGPRTGPGRNEPEEPALPSRELIFLPHAPLLPDTAYVIRVRGVTNIRGVAGGGGTAAFVTPAPPPPDTAAGDTVDGESTPGDTTPGDIPPADTVPALAPDSVAAPADTIPAGPEPATTSAASWRREGRGTRGS